MTMDFDFVIPLSIDGLQEASSSRQYSVAYVSTIREIPERLQGKIFLGVISGKFINMPLQMT